MPAASLAHGPTLAPLAAYLRLRAEGLGRFCLRGDRDLLRSPGLNHTIRAADSREPARAVALMSTR